MISASILGWLGLEKQPEKVDENHKGTIHILRKHFYSTELNLTPKLFTKTLFCQNRRISISTLHFDEIFTMYVI